MTIPRRPVDGDPGIRKPLAGGVDVVDAVREMAEVAALAVVLGIPVVRQLNLGLLITGGGEKDQREASLFALVAFEFLQPQRVAVKSQRGIDVRYPDHRVQILHEFFPVDLR